MYEQMRKVGYGETGPDGYLKLSSMVDFMQDCCGFQLDADSAVQKCYREFNATCYIVLRQINIFKKIKYGADVKVRTWVFQEDRDKGHRNTLILDENDEVLVAAYGLGTIVNLTTGHPVRREPEFLTEFKTEPKYEDMEYYPRKISLKNETIEHRYKSFEVGKIYLDRNAHVNNARYVDIAEEYISDDFDPEIVRIVYKNPAKLGDNIYPVRYATEEDRFLLGLVNKEDEPYAIFDFRRRK